MQTFLIAFVVIAIAVLGMAVGVLFGRRGIQGSCGGLNTIQGLESSCSACCGSCEEKNEVVDKG